MNEIPNPNLIAIIIFWNIARGPQAVLSLSKTIKHVNCVTTDEEGLGSIFMDFDRQGFLTRSIKSNSAQRLIEGLKKNQHVEAIIAVAISEKAKHRWFPFLVRSCNEIVRYATGVDVGFTFNPVHLYYKLLKYSHSRNYEILSQWRRDYGIHERWWWSQRRKQRNQSTNRTKQS